eukprot:CAMPEP_0197566026 /NCGR_PEP_ID=MMETSP1320-20131121/33155_1 /TAXON_ID=91990 /ORGANISM="Bolidomonas sp., Strain RCC2347" /LENGTH=268 /DNA_ID=CAMNT_0043128063 /DNA_START=274 /DNA_END=1077 /DNA_ORIENTATION=+
MISDDDGEDKSTNVDDEHQQHDDNNNNIGNTNANTKYNNLPFGRRHIEFFDAATASTSSTALNILKNLHSLSPPYPPLSSLHPSSLTSAGLLSSLLLQSLTVVPKEALKGLSSCYASLISSGLALLSGTTPPVSAVASIESALTSSLTPPSASCLLGLSRLRSVAPTSRLRFRFCERLAPHLLRPPSSNVAVLWSVRHQADMRAAVVVCEVIMDNAEVFFREGWMERGRREREAKRGVDIAARADGQDEVAPDSDSGDGGDGSRDGSG